MSELRISEGVEEIWSCCQEICACLKKEGKIYWRKWKLLNEVGEASDFRLFKIVKAWKEGVIEDEYDYGNRTKTNSI